jgi:hypothetical protein
MIADLADLLLPGRDLAPAGAGPPAIHESAVVGGVALLVGHRLRQEREGELPALAAGAIEIVLTPYLGTEEARRVAAEAG